MGAIPAKGSKFSIESSQPAPVVMPAGAAAPHRMRVLVVEDNVLNQELVLGYLEGSEYDVTLAGDGRQGVEAFERERFDVVLMDWQMPEMDGLDATRRIREIEQARALPRTPIIAVTAHGQASHREECLAAGMDDYVLKPYSFEALMNALRHWTSHR
jgi:two-component system sensor histidine kinase/response regulator